MYSQKEEKTVDVQVQEKEMEKLEERMKRETHFLQSEKNQADPASRYSFVPNKREMMMIF